MNEDIRSFSFSKISTFTTCPFSYSLRYLEHLTPKDKSPALILGGSMAVGLATFRRTGDRAEALNTFASYGISEGMRLTLQEDPKRSVERGAKILSAYMDAYPDEPEKVMRVGGLALVEQDFKIPIYRKDGTFFLFEGVIDGIFQGKRGKLDVIEDKTVSRLGSSFFKKLKQSLQVSWYLMASMDLGLIAEQAPRCILNAIYIHEKNLRFERDMTIKSKAYLALCREDLINLVDHILAAEERGIFPRYGVDGDTCLKYGGCDFLPICNTRTNPAMMKKIKETQYVEYKSRKKREEVKA